MADILAVVDPENTCLDLDPNPVPTSLNHCATEAGQT